MRLGLDAMTMSLLIAILQIDELLLVDLVDRNSRLETTERHLVLRWIMIFPAAGINIYTPEILVTAHSVAELGLNRQIIIRPNGAILIIFMLGDRILALL